MREINGSDIAELATALIGLTLAVGVAGCGDASVPGWDGGPRDGAAADDAGQTDADGAAFDGGGQLVNVVTDDFERSVLGSSWIAGQGTGIVNDSDFGVTGTGGGALVQWVGTTLGPAQFSEALVCADKHPDMMVQVYVRRRATDAARYGFHYNLEVSPAEWQIKYDGVPTAQTAILVSNSSFPPPGPEDRIRIEAVGNVIRGLVQCATCTELIEVVEVADNRPQAINGAGPPGMVARERKDIAAGVTYPAPVVEEWRGGEIAP